MHLSPLRIVFVVLLVVFFVVLAGVALVLIENWVNREYPADDELVEEMYRGLTNPKLRIFRSSLSELPGNVTYNYPEVSGAVTLYTVPAGKRAFPVGCLLNNEHGSAPQDIVFGLQDANNQIFGLGEVTGLGPGSSVDTPRFSWLHNVWNAGDSVLIWCAVSDLYVQLDVVEFDTTADAPYRIGGVGITDTAPFTWTAQQPVILTAAMGGSHMYQTALLQYQVSVNDVPRQSPEPSVQATANTPQIFDIEYGLDPFGLPTLINLYTSRQGMVLYPGDVLKVSITSPAGAGPMTVFATAVNLQGDANNPTPE